MLINERFALSLPLLSLSACAITMQDILAAKIWLDRFVYNNTLKTIYSGPHAGVFHSCEEKAREQNLSPWPPVTPPALCLLGFGLSSMAFLNELIQRFPELQIHVFHLDSRGKAKTEDMRSVVQDLQVVAGERGLLVDQYDKIEDFDGLCHAVSWSADTPRFSFGRYARLFGSVEYVLGLVNLNGCTPETRHDEADKYYCEYLYSAFRGTLCGQLDLEKESEMHGEHWMFPSVDTECSDTLCMCHIRADALEDDIHVDVITCPDQSGDPTFVSQWGQDFFLYHNVFASDLRSGIGTYVDIGASHPNHLSNTKILDHCFGWRGLCIEPNPRMRPLLHVFRSCEVITKCSWSNVTRMKFGQGGELSAVTNDDTLLPSEPFSIDTESTIPTFFEAECNPLQHLLDFSEFVHNERQSQAQQRTRIDLMSIDVEGAEIEVLRDFDFSQWDIRCIVVETSRRSATAVDSILLPHGFVQIAVLGKDAVYVSRQQLLSMPVERLTLPEKILWNEPGANSETTPYKRFQRYFGVNGNLDEDVGDQRLHNETQMELQHAKFDEWQAKLIESHPGEEFTSNFRKAMQDPEVAALLREPKVKSALNLLHTDQVAWLKQVKADMPLWRKMEKLMKEGVINLATP